MPLSVSLLIYEIRFFCSCLVSNETESVSTVDSQRYACHPRNILTRKKDPVCVNCYGLIVIFLGGFMNPLSPDVCALN